MAKYCPDIRLEELKKITKAFCQNVRSASQDSNQIPSEFMPGSSTASSLLLEPISLFCTGYILTHYLFQFHFNRSGAGIAQSV
jgi:hypothetical protein